MKSYLYGDVMYLILSCLTVASCTFVSEKSLVVATDIFRTPSATRLVPVSETPTFVKTIQPTQILTSTLQQIVVPAVTMSSQEAENALLKLLKTNGNCMGKCVAGIYPDSMTVQDAIEKMAQWGMVRTGENSQGKTFINLVQNPLHEKIIVNLAIGTWARKLETIDRVSLRIRESSELFVGEDIWLANREAWQGFRLDNILKAYGIPTFVGYFFQTTVEVGAPLEGRTIAYDMELQYEEINLIVHIGALAYYDGESLFLCPSKDPRSLGIEINPERSLKELQGFSPVSWQALTGTDLGEFYRMFTDNTNLDPCVKTDLEQIQSLQPYFR
jgi:hypothetical protein